MPPVGALAQQVAEKGVGGAVAAGLPRHNLSALNPDWRREAAATPFFSNLSEMGPLREPVAQRWAHFALLCGSPGMAPANERFAHGTKSRRGIRRLADTSALAVPQNTPAARIRHPTLHLTGDPTHGSLLSLSQESAGERTPQGNVKGVRQGGKRRGK